MNGTPHANRHPAGNLTGPAIGRRSALQQLGHALTASAALSGGLLAPARTARAADARVLRIGFQKGGLLLWVKTHGLLDQRLTAQGWTVQWLEFPAGPQLIEGINVGSIDFGVTGAPPPIFAQAAGIPFLYVGAEPGQPASEAVLVPEKSPIRRLADLKGRSIGLQKGSSSHYLLIDALTQAGLRYSDIRPVFLPPADARAAFERGAIDAWVVWDPYLSIAQASSRTRVLGDFATIHPDRRPPWSFYLARREFVQTHGDVIRHHVLPVIAEEGAWANAHVPEIARLMASSIRLDETLMRQIVQRTRYGARPVTADIAADQQHVADAFAAQGVIPRAVNVRQDFWLPAA
jgi:sulfonate transport system substrate-binding protein